MTCGYCGREITDDVPQEQARCGACPGGCRFIHCPHCGYRNPAPPRYLRRRPGKDHRTKE